MSWLLNSINIFFIYVSRVTSHANNLLPNLSVPWCYLHCQLWNRNTWSCLEIYFLFCLKSILPPEHCINDHEKSAWSGCITISELGSVSDDVVKIFIYSLWKRVWHDPVSLNMQRQLSIQLLDTPAKFLYKWAMYKMFIIALFIFILSYSGHFKSMYYLEFFFHLLILKVAFGCLLPLINQIVINGEEMKTILNPVLLKKLFVKFKLFRLIFCYT